MHKADDQASLASHGCVHGITGKLVTQKCILGIGWRTPDQIGGIEAARYNWNAFPSEIGLDLFAHEEPDVLQLHIP